MGRDILRASGDHAGRIKHQIAAIRAISVGCISLHFSPVNGTHTIGTWAYGVRTRCLPRDVAYGIFPPGTGILAHSRPPISEKLLVSTNKQYIQEDKNMPAIQTMFTFDPQTRVHTGSRPAQVVGGKPLMQSAYATATPPPETIPEGHVARWTGTAWETVEDHRQHMDSKGTKTGGTPYWMPAEGDDHTSPPRYMETPGPLPAGAVTERPAKSPSELLTDTKAAKRTEIKRGYDAALAASLTMPAAMPTSQDVAVGAALFAVDDAEGLAFIQERHAARRDELLAAVDAADSVEAVQAVDVSYDV